MAQTRDRNASHSDHLLDRSTIEVPKITLALMRAMKSRTDMQNGFTRGGGMALVLGVGIVAIVAIVLLVTQDGGDDGDDRASGTSAPADGSAERDQRAALARELMEVIQLAQRGQHEAARDRAEQYISAHPEDGHGPFALGYMHHKAGNFGRAVPHFERSLKLSPDYFVTHHFLGESYFLLGELEQSRRQHEAHLNADQDEPDAWYGIGLVDLEEGKLDEAEACFRRAIELHEALRKNDPQRAARRLDERAKCHARLGDVYFAQDRYEPARHELVRATTMSPGTISALYTLSLVYRRLGEHELADQTLQRYEDAKQAIIDRAGRNG